MNIELYELGNTEGRVAVSIMAPQGFVPGAYRCEDGVHEVNRATFNVVANYCRLADEGDTEALGRDRVVMRMVAGTTFLADPADAGRVARDELSKLTRGQSEYDSVLLGRAIDLTRENFLSRYKEAPFRAYLHACEFADAGHGFSVGALYRDVMAMNADTFKRDVEHVIDAGSFTCAIAGPEGAVHAESLRPLAEFGRPAPIAPVFEPYDPYLRADAHILDVAREEASASVLAFDFLSPSSTNLAAALVGEIALGLVPDGEAELVLGVKNASLVLLGAPVQSFRQCVVDTTPEEFERARVKALLRYAGTTEQARIPFARAAACYQLRGVRIGELLALLDACSHEGFVSLCQDAGVRIAEAQVYYAQGGR